MVHETAAGDVFANEDAQGPLPLILIPVIDLKDGEVVHACLGKRDAYRPVRSRLCAGHAPVEVVGGFLRLHPFATVYIADLDSIERRGDNLTAIRAVRARFPRLDLWVDAGFGTAPAVLAWREGGLGRPVVGTESLAAPEHWTGIVEAGAADVVLSLDFGAGEFLGPREVLAEPQSWPRDVVVMTLGRVGGAEGPDLDRVRAVRRRAGGRRVFAAGGVRDGRDVERLAEVGADGALLASALHDGRIGADDVARARAGG